jgi:hypothetical protein
MESGVNSVGVERMTEYVLPSDVEQVLAAIRPWTDEESYSKLTEELKGKQQWLVVEKNADPKLAVHRMLLATTRPEIEEKGPKASLPWLDALIEQTDLAKGTEEPQWLGKEYDTVTAFGEWAGELVMAVQKDGAAGMVYKGDEIWLGEGAITEIGCGPKDLLACVFNGALFYAGKQKTGGRWEAESLRALEGGDDLLNPFMFNGKLAYVKTRQGWFRKKQKLVRGWRTKRIGKKAEVTVGKGRLGYTHPNYDTDRLLASQDPGLTRSFEFKRWQLLNDITRTYQHPPIYREGAEGNEAVPTVKEMNMISGNLVQMVLTPAEGVVEGRTDMGCILVPAETELDKYVLFQHPTNQAVYDGDTLDVLNAWAEKNLSYSGHDIVSETVAKIFETREGSLYSGDHKPTYQNCLLQAKQFAKRCLTGEMRTAFEEKLG